MGQCDRFAFSKDTWPPIQPKDFTPVYLLHHRGQRIKKPVFALKLAEYINSDKSPSKCYPQNNLKEAPDINKTIKQLVDILAPQQESDDAQCILVEGLPRIGKSSLLHGIAYKRAKKFTPLILIHREKHCKPHQAVVITELGDVAALTGDQPVSEWLKPSGHHPFQEICAVTEDEKILSLLVKNGVPQITVLVKGPPEIDKYILPKEIAYWWDDKLNLKPSKFV